MSSVVGDSQISSTKYRKHLIALVELAVSYSELCFARPLCTGGRTGAPPDSCFVVFHLFGNSRPG